MIKAVQCLEKFAVDSILRHLGQLDSLCGAMSRYELNDPDTPPIYIYNNRSRVLIIKDEMEEFFIPLQSCPTSHTVLEQSLKITKAWEDKIAYTLLKKWSSDKNTTAHLTRCVPIVGKDSKMVMNLSTYRKYIQRGVEEVLICSGVPTGCVAIIGKRGWITAKQDAILVRGDDGVYFYEGSIGAALLGKNSTLYRVEEFI